MALILKCDPRQVWKLLAAGKLPEPFRISPQRLRWRRQDVIDWIAKHVTKVS